jgi:hypothetical protein
MTASDYKRTMSHKQLTQAAAKRSEITSRKRD